jgi:hypothetical protein
MVKPMQKDSFESQEHWSRVYSAKPTESVSWFQEHPAISLEMIARSCEPPATVLDVGAGAAHLVDRLIERGYRPGALDIVPEPLEQVQKRLGDRSSEIEWFITDVTRFDSPHPWDVWHDRAVFHFLTRPEEREMYRSVLRASTRSGSTVIVATFGMNGPDRCSGLPTVRYSPESLSEELGHDYDLVETAFETHQTPSGVAQEFVFCRFERK